MINNRDKDGMMQTCMLYRRLICVCNAGCSGLIFFLDYPTQSQKYRSPRLVRTNVDCHSSLRTSGDNNFYLEYAMTESAAALKMLRTESKYVVCWVKQIFTSNRISLLSPV